MYYDAFFAPLEPGGTAFGTLDIIPLAANSTLTLNLLNPGLPTGVFVCGSSGNPLRAAQDSTPFGHDGIALHHRSIQR